MTFGDYIRTLRTDRGWTQPEAASRAGIEQSYLSKLETGKSVPSGEVYDRLMGCYGVDPEAMIDVLVPEELERLREIDVLRGAMLTRSEREKATPRRWLAAALALLVIGGAFIGLSQVDGAHPETSYTYMSDGVVSRGAGLESEPAVPHEKTRFTTKMRGPAFSEPTEAGGVRIWRLVGSQQQWRPARFGWALVPGIAGVLAAVGCFFLARRWN